MIWQIHFKLISISLSQQLTFSYKQSTHAVEHVSNKWEAWIRDQGYVSIVVTNAAVSFFLIKFCCLL